MIVKQVPIESLHELDTIWDIHDQCWREVYDVQMEDTVNVFIVLDNKDGISADRGHMMFRRLRSEER